MLAEEPPDTGGFGDRQSKRLGRPFAAGRQNDRGQRRPLAGVPANRTVVRRKLRTLRSGRRSIGRGVFVLVMVVSARVTTLFRPRLARRTASRNLAAIVVMTMSERNDAPVNPLQADGQTNQQCSDTGVHRDHQKAPAAQSRLSALCWQMSIAMRLH